ncbi:DMT family transporter [Ammoniphilus sp. YIM 78166]|uniref:DMT family transporter n=1 Tax=Ammoniphilus sp. YIM 78166 TaxID=1644106 RepID=UPI00107013D9|nr:DMT family transporter [Ammoniphilus sp. YIM 78166]
MKKVILPHVLLLGACICWGVNPVVGKVLNESLHPVAVSTLRWLTALLILIPLTLWREKIDFRKVLAHWKLFFFTALFGVTLFQTCTYIAVKFTSPTNTMLINTATPILIACFYYFFRKEVLHRIQVLGMVLATAGVCIVLSQGKVETLLSLDFNTGDLIMVGAVLAWAAYSILSKELMQLFPLLTTITITSVIGVVLLLPAFLWTIIDHPVTGMTWETVSGIIYLAISASVLAFLWWNYGMNALGTHTASMYLYLVPVITALVSTIVLREWITLSQVIGGLFVAYGVYLTTRKRPQPVQLEMSTKKSAM